MHIRLEYILTTVLALLLLTSCNHKDLYHGGHVATLQVRYDWQGDAPASVSGMTLLLYPADGGSPLRFPFSDVLGGTVNVVSGDYRAVCVNDDELLRLVDGDSWTAVSVTTGETDILSRSAFGDTRTVVPRTAGTGDEPVLREPPLLFADTCSYVHVRVTDEVQVLTLRPQMPLGVMHVRVAGVENVQYVKTVSGAVSGLSSSLSLTTFVPSEQHCTMPVQLHVTEDGAIEGDIRFFGHCPATAHEHVLTVYTMLVDWSKQATHYDVTAQLHRGDAPGTGSGGSTGHDKNPVVTVESLALPEPTPAEGGYEIGLDEWTTTGIDLNM